MNSSSRVTSTKQGFNNHVVLIFPSLCSPSQVNTDDSHGRRKGRYAWDGQNKVNWKVECLTLPPDRIWECVWCHSLASLQQLDAGKENLWLICIMDVLELCFLWSRSVSGVGMTSLPTVLLPKPLSMVVLKPSHHTECLFQHHSLKPRIACGPVAMGLITTNAMRLWAHVHRTHWFQHATYHHEAAGLTLEWHLENSTMVSTIKLYCWRLEWHPLLLDQEMYANLRLVGDTVLPRAVIQRFEWTLALLLLMYTPFDCWHGGLRLPPTLNWSFSRRDTVITK